MFGLGAIADYAILTFIIKVYKRDYIVDLKREIAIFGLFEVLKYLSNDDLFYNIENNAFNVIDALDV